MADVFEALCGALCMDKGWQAAERFILSTIKVRLRPSYPY